MVKNLGLLYSFCLLWILMGCSSGNKEEDRLPFSPYVEAFTSGNISRYAPVYLIFSQDIDSAKVNDGALKKLIRIKPEVKGDFRFENNRTIVFKPTESFERNMTYKVTVDLSEWFGAEEKPFAFSFSTLPMALRASLQSMDIHAENENGYDIQCVLFTPDREKPKDVESLVAFSEEMETVWKHSPDGKKHEVTLSNVPKGLEKSRKLHISVASNKWNVAEEILLSVNIPDQNSFDVYDVTFTSEPERYVEVSFTQLLDNTQDFRGLAFIAGNTSETVNVEGNKLRLYPDTERTGALNVHLNKEIRSKSGLNLLSDQTRQVVISENLPEVRFIGNGVIIPESAELTIPFQSIYLRGVVVRVIKVLEQNIGQFLQINHLDDMSDLMRVGRLVARKTIFLDEDGLDLAKWNTFGIDLKQMIEPEPGAIYRVELSFDKDLSVYPCNDTVKISKEQILVEDEIRFKEESNRFDGGGYYYMNSHLNWAEYNYKDRNNPCTPSYYFNTTIGKNVLATNLGLMAMAGEDNEMIVLVHNLLSTNPVNGVKVAAYNFQQQLLAEGVTDGDGMVRLSFPTGKPFYLVASLGTQRSYLRVDAGSSLSLSSFDVSGEVVQKGIKGFIYGERGVWRPGDTLHLSFMLNDRMHKLPANHPVVMELYNPLGQLYVRKTQTRGELGLYAFALSTESDAPTGVWNVKVDVGGVSFTKRIRIESIKPNRLKIQLAMPEKRLLRGEPINGCLHVEWLQGAKARNLKYDIQGTFISTPTVFDGYKGFVFDDPSRVFNTEESKLLSGTTDEQGNASLQARFEVGTAAPGMLLANLVTRVYEESGDFSLDGSRMLYSPYRRYVGIRSPQEGEKSLDTGKGHTYEIVSVDPDGNPQSGTELDVKVYKVDWYWWWSSDHSMLANYVSDKFNKPVKCVTLRTGANGRASFSLSFKDQDWGTYFISVKDKDSQHATGVMNYYDLPYNEGRRNVDGRKAATMLTFKTDKDTYQPGEKMVVTIPSVKGSRAIVNIENGSRLLSVSEFECEEKETILKLDITPEMQPNAYVHITLLQPHGMTTNDLPIRLYGVVPFTVTSPDSRLHPVIQTAAEIKPETDYTVIVSEQQGQEMAYTLAIVDEGLLDLTHFRTPEPWNVFNAREALGVNTWDLYNYVVGAYGGRIEQLFSIGGDDALNRGPKAIVNRFKPVVQFDGPFLLKKGEKRRHTYAMPNYNGRVKVMVVAGNGRAYGDADKTVMVRKPVMLLGTLPRVIGIGEEMVVPATVFATENGVGDVSVSIACSSNMEIVGGAEQTLHFDRQEDKSASFRIRVKDKPGVGQVTITAVGKGERSVYKTDIEIRSVSESQWKVIPVTLEAGQSWKETVGMPGMEGSNRLSLEVSDVKPLNLSARLSYLLGYPHGCIEQMVSKGFPQLYLNELVTLSKEQSIATEEVVKEVIRRMRSYQTVDGGFAYWPGTTAPNAWATAYAVHFLLSAERKGYLVPEGMKRNSLNYLRRVTRDWKRVDSPYRQSEETIEAYRLYVLALAGQPEMGAMNRMKEYKSLPSISRWLLAASYASVGRADVAASLVEQTTTLTSYDTVPDFTFGSDLRDESIRLMTLCLLDKGKEAASLAGKISDELASDEWFSTQSTAFALLAMSEYIRTYPISESMEFSFSVKGKDRSVRTKTNLWTEVLLDKAATAVPLEVKNTGKATLFVRVVAEGTPRQGEIESVSEGLSLAVSYVDITGKPIDISNLQQGTNFTAVVTVKNPSPTHYTNLVLTELFPVGWEILNTRFLHEGTASLSDPAGISYQDIRDDRVCSYIDQLPSGRQVTVRIHLCAVYPGRFYLPPVSCEAMYNHRIRANTASQFVVVE